MHVVKRIQSPRVTTPIQLVSFNAGMPMEEALVKAGVGGTLIVPNRVLGTILVGETWSFVKEALPCWTGTLAAYDKPGQTIGKAIEYVDYRTNVRYVFFVPQEHVGKKDVLFITEHPNFFFIRDGNNRIVQARELSAIEGFGSIDGKYREEGWYRADPIFDLPVGAKSNPSDPDARYLWRAEKMVSLISRGYGSFDIDGRRIIDLFHSPSDSRGLVMYSPGCDELYNELKVTRQITEPRSSARVELKGKGLEKFSLVLGKDAEILAIIKTAPRYDNDALRKLIEALRSSDFP